jgi:hypothetical protein
LTAELSQIGSFIPQPDLSAVKAASKRLSDATADVQLTADTDNSITAAVAQFKSSSKHAYTQLLLARHAEGDYLNIQRKAKQITTSKTIKAVVSTPTVQQDLWSLANSKSVPGNLM